MATWIKEQAGRQADKMCIGSTIKSQLLYLATIIRSNAKSSPVLYLYKPEKYVWKESNMPVIALLWGKD